ncbi:MAG: hypothetical protein ACHP7J_07155 [Terriglobales bacterium]
MVLAKDAGRTGMNMERRPPPAVHHGTKGDLVNLAIGAHLKGAAGVAIAGLLLFYMTRSGVRDYFGARMK